MTTLLSVLAMAVLFGLFCALRIRGGCGSGGCGACGSGACDRNGGSEHG